MIFRVGGQHHPAMAELPPLVRFFRTPAEPFHLALSMAMAESLLQLVQAPVLILGPSLLSEDSPRLSIGYFQPMADVPSGSAFLRRLTGGGTIHHTDQYTCCLIVPPGHPLGESAILDTYQIVNSRIAAALGEAGMDAVLAEDAPLYDPRLPEHAGDCFQRAYRHDILVAGSKAGATSRHKCPEGCLVETGLRLDPAYFPRLETPLLNHLTPLLGGTIEESAASAEELALAGKLFWDRYATDAWNKAR